MKKLKKFFVNKGTCICLILLTVICGIFYYICCNYINFQEIKNYTGSNLTIAKTLKDILLAILSICGTNLLVSAFLTVKSQNSLVTDIIQNDVFSDAEFYENMKPEKKKRMFQAIERSLFFKNDVSHKIFDNIREKLQDSIKDYYYNSCNYIVTCKVTDTYIEKEITKKIALRACDDEFTIKDFTIGTFRSKKISGVDSFILHSVKIDSHRVEKEEFAAVKDNSAEILDNQNGYDLKISYKYTKPLKIEKNRDTTIEVKYTTRTTIDDCVSTFRVGRPCKNFSLLYTLNQDKQYRLFSDAFGFLDNAGGSPNNAVDSNVNVTFSDWIFKYDGVTVAILTKK